MQRRLAVGITVLAPLAVMPVVAASSAQAASVVQTCDGSHTVTFSPKITDTPQEVTATATYELGDDADGLLGLFGSSDCRSTDGNRTSGNYPGATVTVNFTMTASCSGLSGFNWTGGKIVWDDGEVSVLGGEAVPIEEVDHGDGMVEVKAQIASGPFAGESVDIQNQGDTSVPNACETNGIGQGGGSSSVEIQ